MFRLLLILLIFTIGCSGYRFRSQSNPFDYLEIKSLAIPMFVNRSVLPSVNGPFTSEFSLLLSEYSGLKVSNGNGKDSDAVLLGIISSPHYKRETISIITEKFTSGVLQSSMGERNPLYLPFNKQVNLMVRLILIKKPSQELMEILTTETGELVKSHPKIIFDRTMEVKLSFTGSLDPNENVDDGGVLNFTKNHSFIQATIKRMARISANRFKEEMINAF
jgi:hypothetical protein